MGLFGKSFEEQVDAALAGLRGQFPHVRALNAEISGKTVTLTGVAPSLEVKSAVMSAFNSKVEAENTFNKIRVDAPAPAPEPEAAPIALPEAAPAEAPAAAKPATPSVEDTETLHEVVKGETLSAISKKYYGTANKYMKIFEANKDTLSDPDVIRAGQQLRIPK